MEVEFLTGSAVERALGRLIRDYDEFHWAVAWGTSTSLAEKLLSRPSKIRAVTFGLAFAQTDPNLIDSLVRVEGSYVVTEFPKGTYHPKVYGFRSGKRAAAIIGSANFTLGGLGKNHEASVLVTGSADDSVLADIFSFTARSAKLGESVTRELAQRYRVSWKLTARKPRLPRNPLNEVPLPNLKGLTSPLVDMDWAGYVGAVRRSSYHDADESLELLRIAQTWLSAARSFHELSLLQRKALGGVIGQWEKAGDDELNRDWGWFGSMSGAGDFKNRISENDRSLARAVDSIPQKGDVTKEHFDRFVRLFINAFANSHRVGGVPTASRLLAMKRPDVFLCISNPNIDAAASEMGFAKSTLTLDNYWERVVEVIRASDWYNTDKPETDEGQLWECRAAMLDAIFYRPKTA
ncbi:phospholipase D family protein [Mesorhizobium sp. WSM3873]|uniref:phospholipase D family protein n=1 Tax=Mesorhizobium sp. WSM3873 TaxID=1854056 RepID=UPI000AC9DB21|nr:phospholipase D family protein [Mesorhizobium sp. WSM3873]